jgi:hypothetical protein
MKRTEKRLDAARRQSRRRSPPVCFASSGSRARKNWAVTPLPVGFRLAVRPSGNNPHGRIGIPDLRSPTPAFPRFATFLRLPHQRLATSDSSQLAS